MGARGTKYSEAMLCALEDTVYAYEKSICDLENGVSAHAIGEQWIDYGNACRLCFVAGIRRRSGFNCERCPLGPELVGCTNCVTYRRLKLSVRFGSNFNVLLPDLRARLAWIISKAASNGVVLEER